MDIVKGMGLKFSQLVDIEKGMGLKFGRFMDIEKGYVYNRHYVSI